MLSSRLVRGEGEIIEEIVTREKHKEINKVQEKVSSCNLINIELPSILTLSFHPIAGHQGRRECLPEEVGHQQVEDALICLNKMNCISVSNSCL